MIIRMTKSITSGKVIFVSASLPSSSSFFFLENHKYALSLSRLSVRDVPLHILSLITAATLMNSLMPEFLAKSES